MARARILQLAFGLAVVLMNTISITNLRIT
jgi:hypothetical protein